MKTPNIFISHTWRYEQDYLKLTENLDKRGWYHLDYSVPSYDPLDVARKRQIQAGLREQVRQCNIFIIFARLASGNSEWVRFEVDCARGFKKYVIGVRPQGYQGGIPYFIQEACNENGREVGFNTPAIIRLIEFVLS